MLQLAKTYAYLSATHLGTDMPTDAEIHEQINDVLKMEYAVSVYLLFACPVNIKKQNIEI